MLRFANKPHRGAAQATSCRLELSFTEEMYDIRQNSVLKQEYEAVVQNSYHMGLNSMEGAIGGSTGTVILIDRHPLYCTELDCRFCECIYRVSMIN